MIRAGLFLLAFAPGAGWAQDLSFPGTSELTHSEIADPASFALPTAPWSVGEVPAEPLQGAVSTEVWRIDGSTASTLQILRPLRAQLAEAGFERVFECETAECGGFDFRFGIPVAPPPHMLVDLGDFRFLSARNASENAAVTLLVSRTTGAGYVQVMRVGPSGDGARLSSRSAAVAPEVVLPGVAPSDLASELEATGHVVLSDLVFATGSAQLGDGPYTSLEALAGYLAANPDRRVGLVGHTDASGSLEGNIALSKRRAGSVLERLVTVHAVPRRQLQAEGMGYLSPIANNVRAEGREANRRVEAIILSTQ